MRLSISKYSIEFGGAGVILSEYLKNKEYSSVNILVDENTEKHCLPTIVNDLNSYNLIRIPSGESNKTLNTSKVIWGRLQDDKVDRHALMINLGGGVIGDMGGFVASTYMRGIDFIQIPTTLLSQVDASVGGKLGIDFNGLKNIIGLFNNPEIVIIDSSFFKTLPENEMKSGYAEMLKHALIRDKEIWKQYVNSIDWKENLSNEDLLKSVSIKREVVIDDPHERGIRKILNFGHTLGHAIETYSFTTKTPLLHGFAIALGMIGETYLSKSKFEVSENDLKSVKEYIRSIYKIDTSQYDDLHAILEYVRHDKKNKRGKILFSLLNNLGNCTYDIEVSDKLILDSLKFALLT